MSNDLNADAFVMYSKNTTKPLYKVTKLRQRPIIIKRCIYEDLKKHLQNSIYVDNTFPFALIFISFVNQYSYIKICNLFN